MKTIHFSKGLSLSLTGKPQQQIHTGPVISRVAWQAPSNVVLQPDRLVGIGQHVRQGEALFQDRHAPDILHVAPASGTVTNIVRGKNQSLTMIEIRTDGEKGLTFQRLDAPFDSGSVRYLLQRAGLWTQIRERPFDLIPEADAVPEAIFVTALDTRPLSADPAVIIASDTQAFELGLEALTTLSEGLVYLCQAPGKPLLKGAPERVQTVAFAGLHPAGLAGIHIQNLYPVDRQHRVWHLDCQDVMAVGRLLRDGTLGNERVIALAGDQVLYPRLIRCPAFASVEELLREQLDSKCNPEAAVIGSLLAGRGGLWLGRFDSQITVMASSNNNSPTQMAMINQLGAGSHDYHGFAAEPRFDHVNAHDILPVPLMRALLCNDLEQAEALGCLELAPEDLDTLSFVCPVGNDYGAALDRCQSQLRDINA